MKSPLITILSSTIALLTSYNVNAAFEDTKFENTEILVKEANKTNANGTLTCKNFLRWGEYIGRSCDNYTDGADCSAKGYIEDPITGVMARNACCVSINTNSVIHILFMDGY